jgi:ferritin-like metal-binding protein YciE
MKSDNTGLRDLFVENLEAIFYTEKHFADILGKMQGKSVTYELKNTFSEHREVAKNHIDRIKKIFQLLKKEPAARKCEAVKEIIKETDDIIRATPEDSYTRDAGLIKAAQKAKHYSMAVYGKLAALAEETGFGKAARLLHVTLEEEREADTMFAMMADRLIYGRMLQFAEA